MKNKFKNLCSLAMFIMVAACGSDDESSIDLSPFKGLNTEPELTTDTLANGDPLYLNYEYTGSMMNTDAVDNSDHSFTFTPEASGLVIIDLTTDSVEINLHIYVDGNENELNLEDTGEGNSILVLEAEAGVTYTVDASVYLEENDVSYAYTLIVTEANRVRLGLEKDEYWLGVTIDQSETCESTDVQSAGVYEKSFSLGIIFNGVAPYFRVGSTLLNLTETSNNRYEYRSSETDGGEGWSYSSEVVYDLQVNENSGSMTLDAEYTNVETDSETTTCNGTESWTGNVLL